MDTGKRYMHFISLLWEHLVVHQTDDGSWMFRCDTGWVGGNMGVVRFLSLHFLFRSTNSRSLLRETMGRFWWTEWEGKDTRSTFKWSGCSGTSGQKRAFYSASWPLPKPRWKHSLGWVFCLLQSLTLDWNFQFGSLLQLQHNQPGWIHPNMAFPLLGQRSRQKEGFCLREACQKYALLRVFENLNVYFRVCLDAARKHSWILRKQRGLKSE